MREEETEDLVTLNQGLGSEVRERIKWMGNFTTVGGPTGGDRIRNHWLVCERTTRKIRSSTVKKFKFLVHL